jgi:iron complex outermembrane receptor protein
MKKKKLFPLGRSILLLMTGLILATGSFAQKITVKGAVTDAENEPVIGANIVEKGTTNGVITDLEGNFTISTAKDAVIVISYIGYKTQEIKADTQFVEVALEEDLELLEEVVVIGYGSVKKNDATGSVTAIKPDAMNRGLTTNAQDMMIGKIAGVSVITDGGAPGGGASIRIRGGSSLNASNDPLIVIDGLTMDNDGVKGLANPLAMVNPNDIETFTVLKDASATAIYGSRASNGVIIITTKKGQVSEDGGVTAHVTYDGNVSMSRVRKTLDVLGAGEYRDLIREAYGEGSDAWKALGSADTDWQDEIYRTALSTDHNISIYGGVKATPYRLSIGYTKQNGIVRTSDFERYTAALNISPSFLENRLKFNGNLKAMFAGSRYADGSAVNSSVVMDPTQPVRMAGDDYGKYFGGYFQWTSSGASLNDPTWALTTNSLAPSNPVATLHLKDDRARSESLVGNLEGDYAFAFLPGLRVHANGGMDFSTGKQTTDVSPYSFSNNYYGNFGYEKIDKYNLSFNAYAQYMRTAGAHGIDVMAGYEWQHFHRKGNNRYTGHYRPTHAENPGAEYLPSVKEWASENYLVSFFGRVNWALMDRYLFTVTVRHDGSSRFSKGNRWGTFPSFAFGWKAKEEGFLRDVGELSDLKLRLGYGLTGQQNIGSNYAYFASYTANRTGAYYPVGYGKGETYRPDAYNKNLRWERTETYNAGIDFGFLNGRISGSADGYFRRTTDLINDVYVSAGTNFKNRVLANIGSLENRGVEFALNAKPVATKGLTWDAGFNITYNNSKITKLTSGTGEGYYVMTGGLSANTGAMCQAHAVGHPAYAFYVYQQVYDEGGRPVENLFVDRNGDGSINESDLYFYKKPAADVLMGFTSKAVCGRWDAGFSLRASLNNYVYNDVESNSSNMKMLYAPSGFLINRPRMALANRWEGVGNYYLSDYFVRNASFLKCDNVTVGYSFDRLLGHAVSGRAYAAVQNVFTVTKYGGIDPEISMSPDKDGHSKAGIDRDIYPRPLVSLVGLTLNF